MSRLAQDGARDPLVIAAAHEVVRAIPERDDAATMGALLSAVRRRMRYTPDPIDVELVKTPHAILEEASRDPNGRFVGDCDDASVLLAALLGAVGLHSRFVVIPADQARPGEWSHVYVSARASDGRWVALDPIVRGFSVGEEAPSSALSGPRAYFPGQAGNGDAMIGRLHYRSPYTYRGGVNGLGAAAPLDALGRPLSGEDLEYWKQTAGATPRTFQTTTGGGSTLDPTLAAVLGLTGSVATAYIASRSRVSGSANNMPAPFYASGTPNPQATTSQPGMSSTTKTLLIAGGVVVAAVVVMSLLRRR